MSNTFKWRIAQGLEIKWWKRYLGGKDVETYLNWKREYWLGFLGSIGLSNDELEGKKVLDAGCGPAGIFMVLNQSSVIAVDPLIDQYEATLEHFNRLDYSNTEFIASTLEEFNSVNKFDTIFCLNAINHVSNIKLSLDNLFAQLSPGGRLVLSIDCHKYKPLKHLFRLIPGDALHPHQHDLKDYRNMVESRGGVIIDDVLSKAGNIFDYRVLTVEIPQE